MPSLASSNLSSYDYNPVTQRLTIVFHGGRVYTYSSVPQSIADGLGSAESAGKYFNHNIKDIFSFTPGGAVVAPGHEFTEKT